MTYKELFGIQDSNLTDQKILSILEKSRLKGKTNVNFKAGKLKVKITMFPVSRDGVMYDDYHT